MPVRIIMGHPLQYYPIPVTTPSISNYPVFCNPVPVTIIQLQLLSNPRYYQISVIKFRYIFNSCYIISSFYTANSRYISSWSGNIFRRYFLKNILDFSNFIAVNV